MATFFTADQHFGHANIIKHCKRPFVSVEEMDATMIARWNSVVRPEDDVYVLGDFAYRNTKPTSEYLSALNGHKALLIGNHDRLTGEDGWWDCEYIREEFVGGDLVVLCHYPLRAWNRQYHGSYHLFGHVHGSIPPEPGLRAMDVGVDVWDFTPVTLDQVKARLASTEAAL